MTTITKVKLFTIYTCDSGGYGRYPTNEYFLSQEEAKEHQLKSYGNFGWTSECDATLKGEQYKVDGTTVYLHKPESEKKKMIKLIKSLLTPEEIWFVKNNM
jgi:hypothetical protein